MGKTIELGGRIDVGESRRALRSAVERYRAEEQRIRVRDSYSLLA
jgi:hypothetical protein